MTPYVVNEEDNDGGSASTPKPKSIVMGPPSNGVVANGAATANGDLKQMNGRLPSKDEDHVETPDSLPSRSSVSGRSIIGNGKNGKSGALKRVSFGSSKGSMVETLVYDHQDDLTDLHPFLTQAPITNGEDSRVVPAKVRVKFFESHQPVAQVACAPPSPDVTLDFGSDTMVSPISDQSPDYHRQISHDSGVDNPFRPDGELSREADTIVSLIKEGKPITPVKGEEPELDGVMSNGYHDQTDSLLTGPISPNSKEVQEVVITPNSTSPVANKPKSGANGSTPKDKKVAPGVVEVQHSVIVPPSDAPAVEQVVIKKKPKCKCCVVQ